jgi:transcription initiation factor TFIID subunit 7
MDEEQFILRLPPALSERMRLALASKAKRDAAGPPGKFSIQFLDKRNATFTLDGKKYPASLMDLPCIVESHKFTKKRTFYKSGDVGQVLLVRMPGEEAPESYKLPHGITPAAKNAADRISPPEETVSADLVSAVENTIKCIVDNKVAFVRKKSESEKATTHGERGVASGEDENVTGGAVHDEEIEEIVIEHGETTGAPGAVESPPKNGTASQRRMDTSGVTGRETIPSNEDVNESEALGDADEGMQAEVPNEPAVQSSQASDPAPLPGSYAMDGATPRPSPPPDMVDDDDDDDDEFSTMLAQSMLESSEEAAAKARIARADALKKVEEKRAQVADQAALAARALNAVLKQRHLRRKAELESELVQLENDLSRH